MANATTRLLLNHRSIRKFSDREIAPELLSELIACAQMASTSSFEQTYSIIHVTDPAKKDALRAISTQTYVAENAALLVFVADFYRHSVIAEMTDSPLTPSFASTEGFIVATVDATLAAQNLVIAAESEGLGCCYIGSLRNDMQQVIDILDLPRFTYPLYGLVLGYPAQEGSQKPRLPEAEVLHENTYHQDKTAIAERLTAYDGKIADYYAARNTGNRAETWTQQMASKLRKSIREDVDVVVKKQGFLQQ